MAEPFPTYEQLEEGWKQMQAERDRLRAFLLHWTYEGALQTFEDRARFRTEAQRVLAGVETTTCRIYEYDGAYKCYSHGRQWGAISPVTGPCPGWQPLKATGEQT